MARKNLKVFTRIDGSGNIIPGTLITRSIMPKDGRWMQLSPLNVCCNGGDCLISFRVTGTATDITSIQSADGAISWTGVIDNNGYKSFIIPNCYDMDLTVTMTAPGATVTVTAVAVQGTGTIQAIPTSIPSGASPVTTAITTSGSGTEYLVTISG